MQAQASKHKPKGHLENNYEQIDDSVVVQTPRELYESLKAQGYNITYACAPLTCLSCVTMPEGVCCTSRPVYCMYGCCTADVQSVHAAAEPERQHAQSHIVYSEGVVCRRVSITDGKTPDPSDVDSIHSVMYNAPSNSCYVFNCQQGKGRTTVGMVLAVLFLSALVRLCPAKQSHPGCAHWHSPCSVCHTFLWLQNQRISGMRVAWT